MSEVSRGAKRVLHVHKRSITRRRLLPNTSIQEALLSASVTTRTSLNVNRSSHPFLLAMILRSRLYEVALICLYVLGNGVIFVTADTPFDCYISLNHTKFDLTSLAGVHVVNKTRETAPTTMIDSLRFDLCAELPTQSDLPESDQVRSPSESYIHEAHVHYFTNISSSLLVRVGNKSMSDKSER